MLINTVSAIVHDADVSITFDMYDIWQGSQNRRAANRMLQPVMTKREICINTPNRPRTHSRYKTHSYRLPWRGLLKVLRDGKQSCLSSTEPPKTDDNQSRNMGGPAGQLPGKPTYKGRSEVTGIIGNLVPVNSGIRTQ